MAEQQTFTINIKVKDDGTTATLHNITTGAKVSGVAIEDLKKKYQQLGDVTAGSRAKIQMSAEAFDDFASKAQGTSRASGAAAASAMEFGRVLSDMPYGIRGVANNLSQLASNFIFNAQQIDKTTGKVVGFSGALKGMGAAMMGPLGLLVAIQGGLALMEMFWKETETAEEKLNKLADSGVTNTTVRLNYLKMVMGDNTIALEEKQKMVERANGEFEELNLTMDEFGNLTTASANSLQAFTNELMNTAKAAAVVDLMEELIKKQVEIETLGGDAELGFMARLEQFLLFQTGFIDFEAAGDIASTRVIEDIKKKLEDFKKYMTENKLNPYVFDPGDDGDPDEDGKKKVFKQKLLDLEKEVISYYKRRQKATTENEWELLAIEQEAAREALVKKTSDFIEKGEQEVALLKEKLNKELITEDEYKDAVGKIRESQFQAGLELQWAYGQLELTQQAELNRRKEDAEFAHMERLRAAMLQYNDIERDYNETQYQYENDALEQRRLNIIAKYQETMQTLRDKRTEALLAGKEVDDIDQQMTNATAQSKLDLLAVEEEVAENRIEVAGHVGNAFAALADLAGRETAEGKVLAIAAATIDTYVAGVQTMKDPTIPNGPAKVAAMIAVIASGLATVKKIASTKVPGGRDTGGGAGASTTFNPNFNIVGQSAENQLAETVAGQAAEPARAYIVYDDIASANEIEANSVHSASFG